MNSLMRVCAESSSSMRSLITTISRNPSLSFFFQRISFRILDTNEMDMKLRDAGANMTMVNYCFVVICCNTKCIHVFASILPNRNESV